MKYGKANTRTAAKLMRVIPGVVRFAKRVFGFEVIFWRRMKCDHDFAKEIITKQQITLQRF